MDLEFDSDQGELRDSVRAVLDKECPTALVRELVESGTRQPVSALWQRMVDLDWPALPVPADYGGLGLGFVDLAVVVEELGRSIAPGPFVPTTTQFLPAVREAGTEEQKRHFLGAVASGGITGTLAVVDEGHGWSPSGVALEARPAGDGWIVDGEKHHVIEAGQVDEIVVATRLPGTEGEVGLCLLVVPGDLVGVRPVAALDASRQLATIELEAIHVGPDRMLGPPGQAGPALRRAIEEATAAIALEMVGTCQSIFDIALEHAKTRHQFGVPIGSFQAMKHKFANMLVTLERARALAYLCTAAIAEDDDRRSLATSMAKAAAGDCETLLAQEGIQSLGGIGYTWEHDMHLFVKRAKSSGALLGRAAEHRSIVADHLGLPTREGDYKEVGSP